MVADKIGRLWFKLYCYFDIYGENLQYQPPHLCVRRSHHNPWYLIPHTGTLLFMNWTANDGLANLVELIYNQNQIKTFSQ